MHELVKTKLLVLHESTNLPNPSAHCHHYASCAMCWVPRCIRIVYMLYIVHVHIHVSVARVIVNIVIAEHIWY